SCHFHHTLFRLLCQFSPRSLLSFTTRRSSYFCFFYDTATPEFFTLSLHDALPISRRRGGGVARGSLSPPGAGAGGAGGRSRQERSEEHTSELQSPYDLVCRLLLEKKKKNC